MLGSPPFAPKPRIWYFRPDGCWYCRANLEGWPLDGMGSTPSLAYADWLEKNA